MRLPLLFILTLSFVTFFNSSFAAAPPTIVFLGDSLTEGYGINQTEAYPAVLDALLKSKNIPAKIINAGVSGSTSASGESRMRWQLKSKPNILFLALGANDGLRGLPAAEMKKNLEKVILMSQAQKVRVILAGMKIPMNYGDTYRQQYEAVFKDLAKKYSLTFVPFLLEGVATVKQLNIADGIHPNEKGHTLMGKALLPVIEQAIKEYNASPN